MASARNTALKHVNGDYIAFIDSDDYIEKNYLDRLYREACETKSDVVICNQCTGLQQYTKHIIIRNRKTHEKR